MPNFGSGRIVDWPLEYICAKHSSLELVVSGAVILFLVASVVFLILEDEVRQHFVEYV